MIKLQSSKHAEERIKERMGLTDKRQIKELTKKAYHKGIFIKTHYIPKNTLKWVDKKVNNYFGRASQWRIYESQLFLFSKTQTLITVIPIPKYAQIKKDEKDLRRF